jgi:hypothetical protein
LLVLESLISQAHMLVHDEFFLSLAVLFIGLFFEVVGKLYSSLSLLLSFLLLSYCQLVLSELPELGKLAFFLLLAEDFFLCPHKLILSRFLDGSLHLDSSLFFFLEEMCSFIFCFGHLLIQNFFFLVSEFH